MKNALITLAIDLSEIECRSHESFRAYAERYDLDFEILDTPRFRIRPNLIRKRRVWYHIEKFQLFDAFDHYDRILFVDSDTLILPHCPNLFDLVPEGFLGAVYDDRGVDAWKRTEELKRIEKKLGSTGISGARYFNSGVMVLDRSLKDLFRMCRTDFIAGRWPEQTLLNFRTLKEGIPVTELDPRFNFISSMPDWDSQETRLKADIVHYAGPPAKQRMKEDLPLVLQSWKSTQR
jgi:lipopolysaccharide biosynthesis glycosyltransferase